MLATVSAIIRDWFAFYSAYDALRRLDPTLRADLGLCDADLRRIARRAMHVKGPISIYQLAHEEFDGETPAVRSLAGMPVRAPVRCEPARHGAR